jgi:hypothetical protein
MKTIAAFLLLAASAQAQTVTLSRFLGSTGVENLRNVTEDVDGNIWLTGGTTNQSFPTTLGSYDTSHNGDWDCVLVQMTPQGVILRSTFLGSASFQRGYVVRVASDGVVVAGRSGSGLPTTPQSFQPGFNAHPNTGDDGQTNAFVAKFSLDLTQLLWCSYFSVLSGTGKVNDYPDLVRAMDLLSTGDLIVSTGHNGGTYPLGFPLLNQPAGGGAGTNNKDAVVARIKGDGSAVEWIRFLGGSGIETMQSGLRILNDEAYHVCLTTTTSGLATPGAAQQNYGGGSWDFLATKLLQNGDVSWSTYLGGSGLEGMEMNALAVGPGGVYVAGFSDSTNLPAGAGYDQTFNGTGGVGTGQQSNYREDAWIGCLSLDGTQLLGWTFLGGTLGDGAEGVSVRPDGTVWVSGATFSTNFPTTAGAFRPALTGTVGSGNNDAFLSCLSADLSALVYSTYAGGSKSDFARSIHAGQRVLVIGNTNSNNWPKVNWTGSKAGGQDGFVLVAQ